MSNILDRNWSMYPFFYFSLSSLLRSISYFARALMVLSNMLIMLCAVSSSDRFSYAKEHKTVIESTDTTNGLPKRFFQGIIILSPWMKECLMAMGSLNLRSMFFLIFTLLISIFPDHTPTLKALASIY